MNFTPASPLSLSVFIVIVAGVIGLFLIGVHRSMGRDKVAAGRRTVLAAGLLAIWIGALAALVATDSLSALPMSGLPVFFGGVLLASLAAGLSPFGRRLAAGLPLAALVGFQAFRLPLELVLHSWAEQGTIPETMTWAGQNWDIVSGITALVAMPFANRHRAAAWTANVVGAVLLVNVMRVALLSAPVPFGWNLERPLLVAFHLPYALIGPVCVGGALLGHVVLTRALLSGTHAVGVGPPRRGRPPQPI